MDESKDIGLKRRDVLKRGSIVTGTLMAFPASASLARASNTAIEKVSSGPGEVTLKFVNNFSWDYWFDYRADDKPGTADEYTGQTINEGPCAGEDFGKVYNKTHVPANSEKTVTVEAAHKVTAMLRRGPEQHHYICGVTFYPEQPDSKGDCKGGGWDDYHFKNQGQCIRYVNTGKDSR